MKKIRISILASTALLLAAGVLGAADWAHWRGPFGNGASPETGLISDWSPGGANVLWKADFVGRSTPVVLRGRVCSNGRAGEGILRQEVVACFDAETGDRLWERRFNVYHTSVPWTRVGWASITADRETGYLYVQGVGGIFTCLDSASGDVVWQKNFIEEYGFMEGYGGRTQTPTIDQDRVVITFSNTSWGPEGRPLHRLRAFDKLTGDLLWVSQPADSQDDKNTQSTPAIAEIESRRLVIAGNGGGGIHAVEATTGRPIWDFQLSKRGINTSVLVDSATVYASHSEENVDEPTMGRVVAIDATGSGDVTATHELWRAPIGVGYSSFALAQGKLFVLDNSGKLYGLDAASGAEAWVRRVGRIGRAGGPTFADGKIFATTVDGSVAIVAPGDGALLDREVISIDGGRPAEIWGSVAIAYGRLYFTTEEGLYCLGDPERAFEATDTPYPRMGRPLTTSAGAEKTLRVAPYDLNLGPGATVTYRAEAFDDRGRPLGPRQAAWSVDGLQASFQGSELTISTDASSHTGMVTATVGELSGRARVRVVEDLPMSEDFEAIEPGGRPPQMMAYGTRFEVAELDGNRVLVKGPSPVQIHRHITFLGRPDHADYTIASDLMAGGGDGQLPDLGLINSGYTLELLAKGSRPGSAPGPKLQIRSWQAALRMAHEVDFPWQAGVWYRMKFEVSERQGKAVVRGKVWPRDSEEPDAWTIETEDPLPIRQGSAGLSAYSPTPVYWDNIEVTSNS